MRDSMTAMRSSHTAVTLSVIFLSCSYQVCCSTLRNTLDVHGHRHRVARQAVTAGIYRGCDDDVVLSSPMTILSPDYPTYRANVDCDLTVQAPRDSLVRLSFTQFRLESCPDCRCDSLELIDPVSGRRSGKLCGERPMYYWVSDSGKTRLIFHSDEGNNHLGYKLQYSPIQSIDTDFFNGCSGYFKGRTSTEIISSPNYPTYPPNMDCDLTIEAPDNMLVRLSFSDFNLERCGDCRCDNLEITDPVSGRTSGKLCGQKPMYYWVSDSSKTRVIFHSDQGNNHVGYRIQYDPIPSIDTDFFNGCSGYFKGRTSTEISSPDYPTYPPNMDCDLTIEAPGNMLVRLSFAEFDLEECGRCRCDNLELIDPVSGRTSGKLCGRMPAYDWLSDSSKTRINFHSDRGNNRLGYKIQYAAIQSSGAA